MECSSCAHLFIFFGWKIGMPLTLCFASGANFRAKIHELKRTNIKELQTQVNILIYDLYPRRSLFSTQVFKFPTINKSIQHTLTHGLPFPLLNRSLLVRYSSPK